MPCPSGKSACLEQRPCSDNFHMLRHRMSPNRVKQMLPCSRGRSISPTPRLYPTGHLPPRPRANDSYSPLKNSALSDISYPSTRRWESTLLEAVDLRSLPLRIGAVTCSAYQALTDTGVTLERGRRAAAAAPTPPSGSPANAPLERSAPLSCQSGHASD